MAFRGTLPSGQTFPDQGEMQQHQQQPQQQMYEHHQPRGYQAQQHQQHQQPIVPNLLHQQQHQHHNQHQQQAIHHGQQAMYSGAGMGHDQQQQQFYHDPQAQQSMYMHHPQQFQQHPAHQPPPQLLPYANVEFNVFPGYDGRDHPAAQSQYLPPTNVWPQQPIAQQVQQVQQVQRQSLQPRPMQHQPLPHQTVHQMPSRRPSLPHEQHLQPSPLYPTHTPTPPLPQQQPSPRIQPPPQRPQGSPQLQQQQQQQPIPQPQPRPKSKPKPKPKPLQQQEQKPSPAPQPLSLPTVQPVQPQNNEFPPEPRPPREEIPIPPPEPQEQMHFVNLQDIQKQPLAVPLSMPLASPIAAPPPKREKVEDSITVKLPYPSATPVKQEKLEEDSVNVRIPQHSSEPRIKRSPNSSVTNSPALSARSPSITKKSPAVTPKPRPVNTTPFMMAIAEECLGKARGASHDVAMSLSPELVDEYQKLIATSLSCLEAALQSSHLPPREEARVRLRYAAVLQEETENLMEAETALAKGITLCDKHRLFDLKYCMQYLMLKVLFQRNHKAAIRAVDGHISNCEAYKHVQWYYAFRLLKASFYLEVGSVSDAGVLENIRSIQTIANSRGDNALSVLASLLEGFTLLKIAKDGSVERIQACIAQAAKFQFDPTVQITQLTMLTLLLEVSASLQHPNPDYTAQKLRQLQKFLDECEGWHNVQADFLVPIKKQPSTSKTVSEDTHAILRIGEAEGESDFLVMSFMTKMELRSLVFTISGLTNFHKPSSQGRRSTEFWREGLKILDTWDDSTAGIPYGVPVPLSVAIKQRAWRREAEAYVNLLLGLVAASHCQWAQVTQVMEKLKSLISSSTQVTMRLLSLYLTGVYHQGTGDLQAALNIFMDDRFSVPQRGGAGNKVGQQEIALLAGLNRLWIMQHHSCRNDQETLDLIEQLQPHCGNHWNLDLRTAWHNVMAALVTEPAQQLNQQKQHIHAAMAGSKTTSNVLGAAVTLCIMRSRFFENVIGEQALKSARAAAKQAQRSGNILWQSVADGMLAHSYEVQGQRDEAKQELDKATKEARDAFSLHS